MRTKRSLAWLAVALLPACEPTTAGTNPNDTQTRYYCAVRVLDLLTDAPTMDTFVAVVNDEPQAFAQVGSPVGSATATPFTVTAFEQTATGVSTAYLSQGESTVASSKAQTTTTGQRFTVIETGATATGATPAAALTWIPEPTATVPAGQAMVRFVLGAPSLVGAQVDVGGTSLTGAAVLGELTGWTPIDPGAATLTLTPGTGTATSFVLPAVPAGALHTYAVATGPAATPVVLIDITEIVGGDGTAGAPIAPSTP